MFTNKPLEKMTLAELEETRKAWKAQAEQVIQLLIPAMLIGWHAETSRERGREFHTIIDGAMFIKYYIGGNGFDTSKNDYRMSMAIEIKYAGERVANLNCGFYKKHGTASIEWSTAEYLFARPCSRDDLSWLDFLQYLVDLWEAHYTENKEMTNQKRKEALLKLLQKGEF